jgi:hypothetical protein
MTSTTASTCRGWTPTCCIKVRPVADSSIRPMQTADSAKQPKQRQFPANTRYFTRTVSVNRKPLH